MKTLFIARCWEKYYERRNLFTNYFEEPLSQ